jgi:hypothetical protein
MTIIDAVNNFGDNSQEGASAGPMALAVIALLAVVTVLLWRNMTARIKRLPASFPDQPAHPSGRGKSTTATAKSSGVVEFTAESNAESGVGSTAPSTAPESQPETPVEPGSIAKS